MIGAMIIICALIMSFFEKPNLFKKPVKPEKIIIVLLLVGTAIFSFIKEIKSQNQQSTDSHTIATLASIDSTLLRDSKFSQKKIDSLSLAVSNSKIDIQDTVISCNNKTEDRIQKTALDAAERFVKYSQENKREHGITQNKIDSVSSKSQALITFIPNSNCGFTYKRENNETITLKGYIKNSGEGTAYAANSESYLLVVFGDVVLRRKTPDETMNDHNLTSGLMTNVNLSVDFTDSSTINKVDMYVTRVTGYYFLDYEQKKRRNFQLSFAYFPKTNTYSLWDWKETEALFKRAIIEQ